MVLRVGRRPRGGFSLLETTIAVGLLGIGLIMVAAIFPVALTQHRESVFQAQSTELTSKTETLLRDKVDAGLLWSDPALLTAKQDSPWYVMPYPNIHVGGGWDSLAQAAAYTNALDGVPTGTTGNSLRLIGADILSDRFAPADDNGAQQTALRLVWYAFYRRLANGSVHYTAAICKQQRTQIFVEQDTTIADFAANPTAVLTNLNSDGRRFPVPWRVSVYRDASGRLYNVGGAEGLGRLAPRGTKLMIQGTTKEIETPSVGLIVPTGRILTVSSVRGDRLVEVRESTTDLPADTAGSFDVWVFPPCVIFGDSTGVKFGQDSPVIDWKVLL